MPRLVERFLYIPECVEDEENEENTKGIESERAFSAENMSSEI
jgi:hypothetical protein